MRWNNATPDWEELSRRVSRRWGAITPSHLAQVTGNRKALLGLITDLSQMSAEQANRELDEIEQRCRVYYRPVDEDPQP